MTIEEQLQQLEEKRKELLRKQRELKRKAEQKKLQEFINLVGKENVIEFVNFCSSKEIEAEKVKAYFKKFAEWVKEKEEQDKQQLAQQQHSREGGYY